MENFNERYEVAELYTSHSKDGFSYWNPLYLIKDKQTGKIDMHVDKHKIKSGQQISSYSLLNSFLKSLP